MQTKLQAPPEPRLDDWCTTARMEQLSQELRPAKDALLWSGQLETVVKGWVRRQLVDEVVQTGAFTPSPEQSAQKAIEPCPPQWGSALHQAWQQQDQALLAWAEQQWGHGLESLYLAQKTGMDRVTLRMLRVSDMAFSLELYHRIKAGEASFEQLSWQYGEGPERLQGGLIKNQRMADLPSVFFPLLVNLHSFEVQQPRKMGKQFVLYQLLSRQPLAFDQETRSQLLMEQLFCWELALIDRLEAHLASEG